MMSKHKRSNTSLKKMYQKLAIIIFIVISTTTTSANARRSRVDYRPTTIPTTTTDAPVTLSEANSKELESSTASPPPSINISDDKLDEKPKIEVLNQTLEKTSNQENVASEIESKTEATTDSIIKTSSSSSSPSTTAFDSLTATTLQPITEQPETNKNTEEEKAEKLPSGQPLDDLKELGTEQRQNNIEEEILNEAEATEQVPTGTGSSNLDECAPDTIGFEIDTGYVFSAPGKLLDSLPGTLMLTDCLETCQRNETCLAVNYETGLCVLFSANADQLPGALTKSQFPVFTIYAQKSCLGVRPCDARAWSIDRVQNYKLNGHAKRSVAVTSRQECAQLCLSETEFTCRSANYDRLTNTCELSEMDRITVAGTGAFEASSGNEYLENNCVEQPNKLCEFKRLSGRILKTVDAVHQDVGSIDECRELCLNSPYRCHSYDYGDTGDMVCRLSHHSRATLSDVQDPYLDVPEAATYELASCYNVTVECGAGDMIARIRTSKLFDGKIYAKGSPKSCAVDVQSALDFELRMGYQDLECNIRKNGSGRYMNDIIVQHHDMIVTSSDLGLAVTCQYDLTNKSITNEVELGVEGDIVPAFSEEVIVDSPNVVMKITATDGLDVMRSAEVGDPLALKFEIMDEQSPYEIFVRELVAMDGTDNAEITLIDSNGCPTDHFIMGPIYKSSLSGKVLLSHFDAFKFPSSEVVQFRALVTPCMPSCEPVQCNQEDVSGEFRSLMSYGRRRRRSLNSTASFVGSGNSNEYHHQQRLQRETNSNSKSSRNDMLLVQSIQITDKFASAKLQRQEADQKLQNPRMKSTGYQTGETVFITNDAVEGFCINTIGLIIAVTIFLIAQLAVIAIWTYLNQRRKNAPVYRNEVINSHMSSNDMKFSGSPSIAGTNHSIFSADSESLYNLYNRDASSSQYGRQF